ncbi:hypothetical protein COY16_04725 [Candidatus Roizmanbacteria bacterium CG_4_10_14_0_2_um_filter_39_13]|uniref:ComEC/Rec2-related protein domain-containing protein n=1 Tax=Candidatus Roizmanbacteria bacterium CG_4_10_14_0_2_um_filter_39_13 TaxID=1974825 RepID=A0A2M7TWZ6_9BACT|nr:MAG: hypothetical protein COY16_04725 [Candidatus Roizmanbacteria bacterium CG_4_10_14_0_2_um_filter_39_13]
MESFTSLINSYFPEPHASLMNGILLGRPLFVTNTFYTQLKNVGLIHIVVLSGMNITLLTAIIMSTIVKYIGRKIASILTIVIIIAFVQFVGAEAPVVRAAIMGILSLIGLLYGRRTIALYLLFLSGLIMVILNYEWLTSISFQLSFSATLGIILFGSGGKNEEDAIPVKTGIQIKKRWIPDQVRDDLWKYFMEELRISLAAQVFTSPIIFWYFRQISFISPIANILVAWLIAPLMILGILTIALGLVSWHLGFVISWLVYPLLEFIIWVVETLAKVPFGSVRI